MATEEDKRCLECKHWDREIMDEPCNSCVNGNAGSDGVTAWESKNPCLDLPAPRVLTKALDTQVGGGHYKDMVIQPVEFIVKNKIEYREANVIKYVTRHKSKNGIEDVRKAMHYCQMIIDSYVEGEQ